MRTSTYLLIRISLILIFGLTTTNLFSQFSVIFTVQNSSVSPIEGATVNLEGVGTEITLADGSATFNNVPVGMRKYTITYANHVSVQTQIYVNGPQYPTITLYTIGDIYQGGIIFYIDPNGFNGLICTPDDLQQHDFGCYGTLIPGADGTAIGTGKLNTQQILSSCSTGFTAADTCVGISTGGYTDWYLPSKDELDSIYVNLKVPALETFMSGSYWSSSEFDANNAWAKDFSTGSSYNIQKYDAYFVRAIRNFGPPTQANAGPDQLNTLTNEITLAANTPIYGTGQWSIYLGGSGSFGSINDPNTAFTGLMGRDYKLVWTISNSEGISADTLRVSMGSHLIGELYQGGKVFYVDPSGQSGLIAATTDQSTGIQWYNGSMTSTYATWTGLDYGKANTDSIIKYQGAGNYAARICYDLALNGYKDWYLPSRDELDTLAIHINEIGNTGLNTYWSSSEYDITSSWALAFDGPMWNYELKEFNRYVRAIRSFSTLGQAPTATTLPATNIGQTYATLNGEVNANELATIVAFEYGTTLALSDSIDADPYNVFTSTNQHIILNLTGLLPQTTYYYSIIAINANGTTIGDTLSFTTGTVVDIDGNIYNTVVIGSQEWMAENLKVTKYRDGSIIPNETDNGIWIYLGSGARCYYGNDSLANAVNDSYGALYNYYAIEDDRKLCPVGWHVPTHEEWNTLETFLGGQTAAGGEMKEAGLSHWAPPNTGATNSSGFSGLPGGLRWNQYGGSYADSSMFGYWWSSTIADDTSAYMLGLGYADANTYRNNFNKTTGFSIRCIKGEAYQLMFIVTNGQMGVNFATVQVDGVGTLTTNESGMALFPVVPIGTYSYTITASSYYNSTGSVTITNSDIYPNIVLTHQPRDIYVSTLGNDAAGDGTFGNPFLTIQRGIDEVVSNDTVRVLTGTYSNSGNTNISIFDKSLTVISHDGPGTAIIDGFDGAAKMNIFSVSCGICTTYHKVGIIGFRIDSSNMAVQVSAGSYDVKIAENRIAHSTSGIVISNGNNIMIERNLIKRTNNAAISLQGADSAFVFKNTIDSAYYGIDLSMGNYAKVVNNIITNPDFIGINLSDLNNPEVNYNDIWNWGTDSLFILPALNNNFVNPLFIDPSSENYGLQTGSPCIDSGDPDPKYNDPDGTRGDMGAFYYPQTFEVTFHVTDQSSNPINGAVVNFGPFGQQTTDTNGDAIFPNATLGNFIYSITAAEFYTYSSPINVTGVQSENVLMSHINQVSFYVSNNLGYVDAAEVTFGSLGTKITDVNGFVSFDSVNNEVHPYFVTKNGHLPGTGSVTVSGANVDEYVTLTAIFNVTFNVTSDGSTPVAGADVSFNAFGTIQTDVSGNALFDTIPNGTYNFTITKDGYLPYSNTLDVLDMDKTEPIVLTPIYNVTFSVKDPSLNPISGADVLFDVFPVQTTDVSGNTIFDSIPDLSMFSYIVSKPGYLPASGSVSVSGSDFTENVTLTPIFNVTFEVKDPSLNPIEAADVFMDLQPNQQTSAAGSTVFDSIPDGTYSYTVSKAGYTLASSSVTVSGANITEAVTLTPIYNVTFNVTGNLMPIENAQITLTGYGTYYTDASGMVTVPDVTQGSHNYSVDATGFQTFNSTLTVTNSDLTENVTLLPLTYNLTFNVYDEFFTPLDGAEVGVVGIDTLLTSSGIISFSNLLDGSYSYKVSLAGYLDSIGTATIAGSDVTESIFLKLIKYNVTFTITDGTNPIPGADVTLDGVGTYTTDVAGQVVIPNIVNASYTYSVSAAGFDTSTGGFTVAGADWTENVTLIASVITHTITFTVTDGVTPIIGASVDLTGVGTILTDGTGTVVFSAIPDAVYTYNITAVGYNSSGGTITLSGADWTENVTMTPTITTHNITFIVLDGATPVPGAEVTVSGVGTLFTDAAGEAVFNAVPDNNYPYSVVLVGYNTANGIITLAGADWTENVTLTPSGPSHNVTFTVLDGATPVAGANVELVGIGSLTTDISGVAVFPAVPDAVYTYIVSASGYNTSSNSITLSGADWTENVTLTPLPATYTLTFQVYDGATALENATITIPLYSPKPTNPSGEVSFFSMPDGTYNYTVTLSGYDAYNGTVTVAGSDITEVVMLQPTTYTLMFNVYDESSSPVQGAEIFIDGPYSPAITDVMGWATFNVPSGNYNYTITKFAFDIKTGTVSVAGANKTEVVTMTKMQFQQYLSFNQGWNIFSTYLVPNDLDLQVLFANLISVNKLVKIQDQNGNSLEFIDPSWVNGIGNISYQQGYKIKVTEDIPSFMIQGTMSPESGSLPYTIGWNISGYPNHQLMDAKEAMQPLIDEGSLQKVQSQNGAAMQDLPGFGWINNIGFFIPGEGYKVRVNANTSLNYGIQKSAFSLPHVENYKGVFNPSWVGNGLDHMNIYLKNATFEGKKLQAGDEIGIFDGNVCVGTYNVSGIESDFYKLKATLDDPYTLAQDGFTPGHLLTMKVWINSSNEFADKVNLTPVQGYNLTFEASGTTVVNLDAKKATTNVEPIENPITSITSLFPNPFNDRITINLYIAKPSKTKIEVFDLLGSRVAVLADKEYATGTYTIEWDRNSESKGRVAPGVYIIKLKAGEVTTSKRIIAE